MSISWDSGVVSTDESQRSTFIQVRLRFEADHRYATFTVKGFDAT